jgi:hypothetical protein
MQYLDIRNSSACAVVSSCTSLHCMKSKFTWPKQVLSRMAKQLETKINKGKLTLRDI